MEGLRWWLLLLTALMFSMSGCASQQWTIWATNPAHFASAHHVAFSMKSHPSEASITEADIQAAAREEWWGRLVPEGPEAPDAPQAALPSMDMTGKWRGAWVSRGLFGDERSSEVQATFSQSGKRGFGRDGVDGVARDRAGTAVKLRFTRVGDTI